MRKDIVFILDRSGSMWDICDATIENFNAFVKKFSDKEDMYMSLFQFDNQYETVYTDVPISHVKPLSRDVYVPRDSTALLAAIGVTVTRRHRHYKELKKQERPDKVMVVVLTDGYENASHYSPWNMGFTSKAVLSKLIKKARKKWGWEFTFLGANMDAISEGGSMGMAASSAYTYVASPAGVREASNFAFGVTADYMSDDYTPAEE